MLLDEYSEELMYIRLATKIDFDVAVLFVHADVDCLPLQVSRELQIPEHLHYVFPNVPYVCVHGQIIRTRLILYISRQLRGL